MKGNTIEVTDILTKDDIQALWKSTWNIKNYNTITPWIKELKPNFCPSVNQKDSKINIQTLQKALSKIRNNKLAGPDMIIGFWYKKS